MAHITQEGRLARIQGPGVMLVASDLHGNLEDFERLLTLLDREDDAVLLLLGDLFHGPAATAEQWAMDYTHLGDFYEDHSVALMRRLLQESQRRPGKLRSLLGNHDHAHVGGPVVGKFHRDEAGYMEQQLTQTQLDALHAYLGALPLMAVSACGVAFTHGAPPATPFDLDTLNQIDLGAYRDVPIFSMHRRDLLGGLLWRRGSTPETTQGFLRHLQHATGQPCGVVCHGHEIVPEGYESEDNHLLCLSSSFGMRRQAKTYLRLDLGACYNDAWQLKPGTELLPLYDPS